MRLDQFIKDLPHGVSDLFINSLEYPAPFDTMATLIANKAVRDFGALKMNVDILTHTPAEVAMILWEDIASNQYEISSINKIMAALDISDESPDYIERRTYGEHETENAQGAISVTSNIGARSSTDTMGATDGTTTNTDTSYESTTGKQTTTSRVQTNQITNGSSTSAATDTTTTGAHSNTITSGEHVDVVERFNNVGEDAAPDYIKKWLAIKNNHLMVIFEKIIVDCLTIPYYEEI